MSAPTDPDLRDRYRPRLLAKTAELRAASGTTTADRKPVELDQQSVGRLSRMDAMQQQAMSSAQDTRRRARLAAIEAALARLAEEEFGWCGAFGEVTGTQRLDLAPTLTRCVDCTR